MSDNWQQDSKPLDKLYVDIFFNIYHYLHIGESDPQDSFRHKDFTRQTQEAIIATPSGRLNSNAALQAISDLNAHYNRAFEVANSPYPGNPGISNYFGVNLWLISKDENIYLDIPSCEYLSDLQNLFAWFEHGGSDEEPEFSDDMHLTRFLRIEDQLHIHCYDHAYEEQVANISTSFCEVANAVSVANSGSRSVISIMSENPGFDNWTNRPTTL